MGHKVAYRPPFVQLSVAQRNATPRTQHYQQPGITRTPAGDLLIMTGLDDNPTADEDLVAGTKSRFLRSTNGGLTWTASADITGYAATAFGIGGSDMYCFTMSAPYGSVSIRKSTNDGATWGSATQLLADDYYCCPPVPLVTGGRIYMPVFQVTDTTGWFVKNSTLSVLHCSTSADPLVAGNWTQTNTVTVTGQAGLYGLSEPCMFLDASGNAKIVCRFASNQWVLDRAVVVDATLGPSASLSYDNALTTIPGGAHWLRVAYDATSGKYLSLINRNTAGSASQNPWAQRTIVSLVASDTLKGTWSVVADIIRSPDFGNPHRYAEEGYQYVDWMFDGNDIIGSIRVGEFGIALNYHQASAVYFFRIKDYYRNLLAPAPANSGVSPSSPHPAATRNGRAA